MRLPLFGRRAGPDKPGLVSLPPPTSRFRLSEQISPSWLWILGVLGSALVGLAIALDMVWGMTNIFPNVSLNAGIGILLFVFLFWLQRRIVRATTMVLVSQLEEWAARMGRSPDEVRAHLEGPVAAVLDFVQAILDHADYRLAWRLADDNWRLCRAQAWLWNNRSHPEITPFDPDEAAAGLAEIDSTHDLWLRFAQVELDQFVQAWSEPDLRTYGAASARREVEDGEIVLLVDLSEHPHGAMAHGPTPVEGVPFLVRRVGEEWRIANLAGDHVPISRWPPDWQEGWTYWDRYLR